MRAFLYTLSVSSLLLVATLGFSNRGTLRTHPFKAVMISIDGLRGEYYQQPQSDVPTLRSLMAAGAYAKGLIPVFPSVTYPNHTSLITGVQTGKHGILSNTVFSWSSGPSPAWFWEADNIKVPTLLDLVHQSGLTSAAVRWPVTLKNRVATWLIPEIFGMTGFYEGNDWDLTVKFTDPKLMSEVLAQTTLKKYTNQEETDDWVAEATAHLIRSKQPDLTIVHLANLDHVEHGAGPDTPAAMAALKLADTHVKTILSAVDMNDTCVFIVGDHGFYGVQQSINVNSLFLAKGWITVDKDAKLQTWKVIAQSSGGQAAIYLNDTKLESEVGKVLRDNAKAGNYRVLDKNDLQKWGSYPEASFAITANEGFAVSGSLSATSLLSKSNVLGQHGHLPDNPKIYSGLIAAGCGIQAGQKLDYVPNVDVAPTVAELMGLAMSNVDGKVIKLKFK